MGPQGLDIVTVALDTDPEAARPFAEASKSTHPSLLDQALLTLELFAFTNVPDYGSTKQAKSDGFTTAARCLSTVQPIGAWKQPFRI